MPWRVLSYFTAPKVRPCTSCFWLNQPNTMIGAIASSDAADSLAQNRPSGLEYDAISAASVPALRDGEVERPERLVPRQHQAQQAGRRDAAHRQRQDHVAELVPHVAPSSRTASRMSFGHFLEVRVQHPHHDRQVRQREDDDQRAAASRACRWSAPSRTPARARRRPASSSSTASTSAGRACCVVRKNAIEYAAGAAISQAEQGRDDARDQRVLRVVARSRCAR